MKQKNNKNFGTTYFALAFIVSIFFEFYFIMTDPYNHFMLLGIGLIVLITGYLTFDAMEKSKAAESLKREEQNDMMIKASKAIYLATKRNSQEAEKQHIQNLKAIEIMMNNMISNEKDMVNIMITKNEEIATKQLTAKADAPGRDMTSLIEQLSESNAKLAKEVQAAITVSELVKSNADLVRNVREVLGGSQTSLNTDNLSDRVTAPDLQTEHNETKIDNFGSITREEPIFEINSNEEKENTTGFMPEQVMEQEEDEFDFESFELPEDAADVNLDNADTASSQEIIDDVNISALNDMIATEGITIVPDISKELDEEMSNISSENTISDSDDNSNKQLTEEEIAALFANL